MLELRNRKLRDNLQKEGHEKRKKNTITITQFLWYKINVINKKLYTTEYYKSN